MKKIILLFICFFVLIHNQAISQIVFSDNFNRTVLSPGGVPAVTYSLFLSVAGFTGAQIGGTDATTATAFTPNQLVTWSDGATPAYSRSRVAAPISGYLAPFINILRLNTGLLCWTFNMRTSSPETGSFASTDNFTTVVLCSTDNTLYGSGKGYGVTFTSGTPMGIQMVKINGGFGGTVTPFLIPTTNFMTSPSDYMSVQIIYDPTTNDWRLYVRDDGTTAFADPSTGVNNLVGCAIDSTYTDTAMHYQGYMSYYDISTTGALKYSYFDNYTVSVISAIPSIPAITGIDSVCAGNTTTLFNSNIGGVWTSGNTSIATAGGTTGVISGVTAGGTTITYSFGPGCVVTDTFKVNPLPSIISGVATLCVGSTISLTNTVTSGKWYSSDTAIAKIDSISGVVTGTSAGTDTITYQLPTGCYTTKTITVNTSPAPITGVNNICLGNVTTLSDISLGGTWSSYNTAIATIGIGTGIVSGTGAGWTLLSYTLSDGCYATFVETINPPPSPITGSTFVVCEAQTISLSDITTTGTWSSSNILVATVGAGTGIVSGVSGGIATISYMLGTGCFATTNVTVNPTPAVIGGPLSVCSSSNINLTNTTIGGTWSSNNTAIATINAATGTLTGIGAGTAIISYTLGTGCYVTKLITVNPLPNLISGPTTVCQGSDITLSETTLGGTWSSSNSALATVGAFTAIVGGVSSGAVVLSYTLSSGCYETYNVNISPLPAVITGITDICQSGGITTLSDATVGGNWSSTNTLVATIGMGSGIVTGANIGSTIISYTLIATGCAITTTVNVHALPTAIIGASGVCESSNITLIGVASGGTWSSSNTAIATIDNSTGVLTGIGAGIATITYSSAFNCSITTVISVAPIPSASLTVIGDSMMCPGGFVLLNANTGVGITYQWYNSGLILMGATTSSYTATSAGLYTVKEFNTVGCSDIALGVNVSINPASAAITPPVSTTFCSSSSVLLSANTGAGLSYQWFLDGLPLSGAVLSTYLATIPGLYAVVVTNIASCSATDTITLHTIPSPVVTVTTSGPTSFCGTDSVTLTGNPGYIYQWDSGGIAISGATNLFYTASLSSNYTLSETNGIGCTGTSSTIMVAANSIPSSTITAGGPTTFCTGGSVTLVAPVIAGYTYQWYNSGLLIVGATMPNYTASTSGNYKVLVTNPVSGCFSVSSPLTVSDIVAPTIIPLSSTSFCWGSSGSLALDVIGAIGINYQWQLGSSNITGATNSTYEAFVPGVYSCIINVPSSCTDTTNAVLLTEYPLPNPIISLVGAQLVTQNYFTTYQWYMDGALISGATTNAITPSDDGTFKVSVTDTNGCQSISDAYILTGYSSALKTNLLTNANDILIFPNPAQTVIYIQFATSVNAILYSMDGKELIKWNDAKSLDIKDVSDGVYLLIIYDEDGVRVRNERVVVSKK